MKNLVEPPSSIKLEKANSLNQWIFNVRYKKCTLKRQRRGQNLRVLAILQNSLQSSEDALKRKQRERLVKWTRLKRKYSCCNNSGSSSGSSSINGGGTAAAILNHTPLLPDDNCWNSEGNCANAHSGGSGDTVAVDSNNTLTTAKNNTSTSSTAKHQLHCLSNDFDGFKENLWSSELNELDNFMHSLNQIKTCVVR